MSVDPKKEVKTKPQLFLYNRFSASAHNTLLVFEQKHNLEKKALDIMPYHYLPVHKVPSQCHAQLLCTYWTHACIFTQAFHKLLFRLSHTAVHSADICVYTVKPLQAHAELLTGT